MRLLDLESLRINLISQHKEKPVSRNVSLNLTKKSTIKQLLSARIFSIPHGGETNSTPVTFVNYMQPFVMARRYTHRA